METDRHLDRQMDGTNRQVNQQDRRTGQANQLTDKLTIHRQISLQRTGLFVFLWAVSLLSADSMYLQLIRHTSNAVEPGCVS